jgi:hypothetical protein
MYINIHTYGSEGTRGEHTHIYTQRETCSPSTLAMEYNSTQYTHTYIYTHQWTHTHTDTHKPMHTHRRTQTKTQAQTQTQTHRHRHTCLLSSVAMKYHWSIGSPGCTSAITTLPTHRSVAARKTCEYGAYSTCEYVCHKCSVCVCMCMYIYIYAQVGECDWRCTKDNVCQINHAVNTHVCKNTTYVCMYVCVASYDSPLSCKVNNSIRACPWNGTMLRISVSWYKSSCTASTHMKDWRQTLRSVCTCVCMWDFRFLIYIMLYGIYTHEGLAPNTA